MSSTAVFLPCFTTVFTPNLLFLKGTHMSAENIETVLMKLDALTDQNIRLYEMIEDTNAKIDCLNTIEIKNGGGRSISFKRSEFFQMLYDRPKEQFYSVADNVKRFSNVFDLIWKFATVVALFVALLTR